MCGLPKSFSFREVPVRQTLLSMAFAGVLVGVTLTAQQPPPPTVATTTLTPAEKAGRSIVQTRCAMCHVGEEPAAEMANPNAQARPSTMGPVLSKAHTTNDAALRQKIKDGSVKMPGYKYTLTDSQVDQVVAYMKTLDKPLTRIF